MDPRDKDALDAFERRFSAIDREVPPPPGLRASPRRVRPILGGLAAIAASLVVLVAVSAVVNRPVIGPPVGASPDATEAAVATPAATPASPSAQPSPRFPFPVDCGELDPATCDAFVASVVALTADQYPTKTIARIDLGVDGFEYQVAFTDGSGTGAVEGFGAAPSDPLLPSPTPSFPFRVDCGPMDEAACHRLVEQKVRAAGSDPDKRITAVVITSELGSHTTYYSDGSIVQAIADGVFDREVVQAHAVLERWEAQLRDADPGDVILLGDLTRQIGTWENALGGNNKAAMVAGKVKAASPMPDDPVAPGIVEWADGRSQQVDVLSAADAFAEIREDGSGTCGDCDAVVLLDPVLGTIEVQTSRGPATVPAWHYAVQGSRVIVTRAAVADRTAVVVPPWDPDAAHPGTRLEGAVGRPESNELVVQFIGAVGPASEPCGADYTAEAIESEHAVAIIVRGRGHAEGEICRLVGALRTATVTLDAPLGNRVVLETQEGRPVPVSSE